jgi:hypothetical protein
MLTAAIRAYRKYKFVKRGMKLLILFHHTARPRARSACTLADCSGTGLAEAQALGWKALPGILSRINACGYNSTEHRRPYHFPEHGGDRKCLGVSGPPAPGRPCDVMSSIGDYESWTGCPKGRNRIMPEPYVP